MRWRPASGYMTKAGRSMWRIWNDDGPAHLAQLNDSRGCPRLFATFGAAQSIAKKLNAASAS